MMEPAPCVMTLLHNLPWKEATSCKLGASRGYGVVSGVLARVSELLASTEGDELLASVKPRIHPSCDKAELEEQLHAWLHAHLGGSARLLRSDTQSFMRMVNASCKHELMATLAKATVWLFVLDDFADNPTHAGADASACEEVVARLMDMFRVQQLDTSATTTTTTTTMSTTTTTTTMSTARLLGAKSVNNIDDHQPTDIKASNHESNSKAMHTIVSMAQEWWQELQRHGMSPGQQHRFVLAMEGYLDANVKQAENRQCNVIQDLETYMSVRIHSSSWLHCSVLLEFGLGIDLPDRLLQHPLVLALQKLVCLHLVFVNDVYSFRKELAQGDLVNLVPVLLLQNLAVSNLNDLACSAADLDRIAAAVVSQTLDAIKVLDRQYLHIIDDINSGLGGDILGMSDDDGLRLAFDKYLQGVSDWLAGSLEWHKHSTRFVPADDD